VEINSGSRWAVYKRYMKKIRATYGLLASLFLIMGMCIYLLFRNLSNIVLFDWMAKPSFLVTPLISLNTDTIWGYLFVFNLPHGLWCLSGLLIIRSIWLTSVKWRAAYGGIFLTIISAIEISQLSENRHGTFDMLDLASYGVSAFVESITYNKFTRRRVL